MSLVTNIMSDHKELENFNKKVGEQRNKFDPLLKETPLTLEKSKWTKLLVFAGLASTIGTAVPTGYAIGIMNSPAMYMRNWCNESIIQRYDIYLSSEYIDVLWSTIVSIFLIGGAIGSLSGSWVANKFGRKSSTLCCAVLFIIAGLCFYFCRLIASIELLLIGRFIVGLASGLAVACLPMYLSEIAPLALRGTLGVFCAVGTTAGVVVAQIVSLRSILGSEQHWHIALSFHIVLVVVCFIPYKFYPESPKWLYVIKGDTNKAERELNRLRNSEERHLINKELEIMSVESNKSNISCSLKDVLKDSRLLLPLVLVCSFHGGQQLSGINAIFNYSVSIFRKAGFSSSAAEWANLGAGSLNLSISFFGPYLMAKFNRRPLLLFSSFFCFFALSGFALTLYFIESVSWFAVGCIVFIFLYIFFYQFGVGPIPYFIGAELFEVAPRSVAMSMGSLSNFMGSFITCMAFPILQNSWGAMIFIPFAVTCAIIFFLTFFFLPETRGRNPTDVALIVSKGFKSKVRK